MNVQSDSRRHAAWCESAAPSPCAPTPCLLLLPPSATAMHRRGAEGSTATGAGPILTESGCRAARGFAVAEPTARYSHQVLHAHIAHVGLHRACRAVSGMRGCVAYVGLCCICGAAFTCGAALHVHVCIAAFHTWGGIACTESSCALRFVPRLFVGGTQTG